MSKTKDLVQTVLLDGEKVLPGSRRPDGTIRKERRIREGFTPQEEQEVYLSRGTVTRQDVPSCPGMDDAVKATAAKQALSKAAKKNEKRKEKAAAEASGSLPAASSSSSKPSQAPVAAPAPAPVPVSAPAPTPAQNWPPLVKATPVVAPVKVAAPTQAKKVTPKAAPAAPAAQVVEGPKAAAERQLRALRKKARQAEGLQTKHQVEGVALSAEEQGKVDKLASMETEIRDLEKQLAAL
mmetsp:Transcript_10352/g.17987  ORF Transcript_10352/g.17987 Transcript_10352/m.17987 type:complete len:238 (+) Transcript_10352:64-777(+)